MLLALGIVADVFILSTYALLSFTGNARAFHWANALGCVPLLVAEVRVGLWQVVVITGTFGVLGWVGVWTAKRGRVTIEDT